MERGDAGREKTCKREEREREKKRDEKERERDRSLDSFSFRKRTRSRKNKKKKKATKALCPFSSSVPLPFSLFCDGVQAHLQGTMDAAKEESSSTSSST